LINGIGTWFKQFSPAPWVIGVCAEGAPSMELSWRAGKPVSTESAATIADGIGVRVPVPEALVAMRATVDEVMLVSDEEILDAMRMLFVETGLVVEPAGAAGLAAVTKRHKELEGQRVATPLCGGNLTADQVRRWLT
jgi:threonine dehydratase